MAAAPTLETNRLKLVSFAEGHLTKRYIGWLNDPEVVRYSEQRHRTHTADSCRRFVATFADGPSHLWAIVAKDAGLGHIGNVNSAVDAPNRTADVAILIGEKKAWGRGFGAEAWINNMIALRAGYKTRHDNEDYSFGAGLKYSLGGQELKVDASYSHARALGDTPLRFSVGYGF